MDSTTSREKTKKEKEKKPADPSQHAEESIHSRMESVEAELIMEILSWVPTLDLSKLSYVCKRWNIILKDPIFHRLHYTHSIFKPNENRVVVFKQSSELYFVDMSDKMSPRQITIDLPYAPDRFSNYYFVGSCNGLLCLGSKESLRIFVLNPFTRRYLIDPVPVDRDNREGVLSWGFGFDESAKLFKVIVFIVNLTFGIEMEARICDFGRSGATNWRNLGKPDFYMTDVPACFVKGRLHWSCCWGVASPSIVSFDLADEEFRLIPAPDVCLWSSEEGYFNLIVLEGCLCIFYNQVLETLQVQLWIMKEYGVKASWVKIFGTQSVIPRSLSSNLRIRGWSFLKGLGSVEDGELLSLSYFTPNHEEATLFSSDLTCDELKLFPLKRLAYPEGWIVHTCSLNWI